MEKEISIANDSVWKKSENYSSKESITRDEVRKQTKILDEKLFKLRYNEAQYFNDAPLRAIFGFSDEDQNQVVTNYVFNHDLIHEKAKLIIQVASENEPKTLIFPISTFIESLEVTNFKLVVEFCAIVCGPTLNVFSGLASRRLIIDFPLKENGI